MQIRVQTTGAGTYLPAEIVDNTSLAKLEAVQQDAYSEARSLLQGYSVPSSLIDLMLSRASNEVYWLTPFDKRALGKWAPWFEQVLVSRCNLNKTLEDRYFSQINPGFDGALEVYVNDLIDCESRVIGDAPEQYVDSLLSKFKRAR